MIYTHSGQFHADDAFFAAAARMLLGYESDIKRVRELPAEFDPQHHIAGDVGGCFDPARNVYDHHQTNGNDDGMAAIGKFWSVNGAAICGDQRVADRVYLTLLGSIDRADIGISDWSPIQDAWRHVSASALIASMNPPFGSAPEISDACFEIAVQAAKAALEGAIANARAWIEMFDVVEAAHHVMPGVIRLEKSGPWQEHVCNRNDMDEILYVIYKSDRGGYMIQAVPKELGSFETRKPLPASWRGLRSTDLAAATGLNLQPTQALFCHPGRFIGGAETLKDAIRLAEIAINK